MYIYNITFNVDKDIEQEWLQYIKEIFIPNMLKSGLLTGATTTKIILDEPQGNSYAIQFKTDSKDSLYRFLSRDFENILKEIQLKFSPKMVHFATELDIIDQQGEI